MASDTVQNVNLPKHDSMKNIRKHLYSLYFETANATLKEPMVICFNNEKHFKDFKI